MGEQVGPQLDRNNLLIENSVNELVALLLEDIPLPDTDSEGTITPVPLAQSMALSRMGLNKIEQEEVEPHPGEEAAKRKKDKIESLQKAAQELIEHFKHKNVDNFIKLMKQSLDHLKRRIAFPSALSYGETTDDKKRDIRPALYAKLSLTVPTIILSPSLEDIQAALNEVVHRTTGIFKNIYQWGQIREVPGVSDALPKSTSQTILPVTSKVETTMTMKNPYLKDIYKIVSEHKEVAKLISMLSSSFMSAKTQVTQCIEQFNKYQALWAVDREQHMKTFLAEEPTLSEFEAQIRKYEALETQVMEEPDRVVVGSLALMTGM